MKYPLSMFSLASLSCLVGANPSHLRPLRLGVVFKNPSTNLQYKLAGYMLITRLDDEYLEQKEAGSTFSLFRIR